jgi:4-hydroxy-tetrahydrodipicolinate synthase
LKQFYGVFTALVTPFNKGEVDYHSLKSLIKFQLDRGIDGLVVNGTTGESPTLSIEEMERIFQTVKAEVGGQVPIILGTGSNSTKVTVDRTIQAGAMGADAALVVVPYYNKPTQQGLVEHYRATAEKSRIPVIAYNVPGRTITRIELETFKEIAQLPNVIGVKEATGDVEFGKNVMKAVGPDFLVTSGDDGTCLQLMLEGGHGVISVASNILPDVFVGLAKRAMSGDKSVIAEYEKYKTMVDSLYIESNPIPVKAALQILGVIRSAEMRLPLTTATESTQAKLAGLIQDLKGLS